MEENARSRGETSSPPMFPAASQVALQPLQTMFVEAPLYLRIWMQEEPGADVVSSAVMINSSSVMTAAKGAGKNVPLPKSGDRK